MAVREPWVMFMNIKIVDILKWASVKLGDTLGMPIWLETINGI